MKRSLSLDALRGHAIITMVLSGSIAYGDVLPAWMYHAQVPPPDHVFNAKIPGITWVDLVFPFFLFSMGAAIPLALHKRIEQKEPPLLIAYHIIKRFVLLAFLAFFLEHINPHLLGQYGPWVQWGSGFLSFGLFCCIFMDWKFIRNATMKQGIQWLSVAVAIGYMLLFFQKDGNRFSTGHVDIIILVLANMALFGSFIWWATRHHAMIRIGLLPFIMALFLTADKEGSWNQWLFHLTPAAWLYKFYFLKYLFIVIPGTLVGDWMLNSAKERSAVSNDSGPSMMITRLLAVAGPLLIVINLWGLFCRQLVPNLLLSTVLCAALVWMVKRHKAELPHLVLRSVEVGAYLLLLGLTFEAYEDGIKKDWSTYSYYFVTTGLAMILLSSLTMMEAKGWLKGMFKVLEMTGRNPMVAYVAGALVVAPFLHLTGLVTFWDKMNANAWLGFLKGVVFTSLVVLVTMLFTRNRWFWKT